MAIQIKDITKKYGDRIILNNYSLIIPKNSFTVIAGASGSGKSTLLNIIGLLDTPDCGEVTILGHKNITPFSSKATKLLRNNIGYLFQNFALIPEKSVEYNLNIALDSVRSKNKDTAITDALEMVGLSEIRKQKVYQCSGGEQQRIAVARLLLKPCDIILADEPTGSLDEENKHIIFNLLKKLQDLGKTVVVVTHDADLIDIADHVVRLEPQKQ